MLSEVQLVEVILHLIRGLSPESQILLFKLAKQTFPNQKRQPNHSSILPYGKYRGPQLTQWEDFSENGAIKDEVLFKIWEHLNRAEIKLFHSH